MIVYTVPTGHIIVLDGSNERQMECLSLADYGKENNLKADFLGLTQPIHGVAVKKPMPLEEKWVVTISTQYGCPMQCRFCDVPAIGYKGNISVHDMNRQVAAALLMGSTSFTKRLNIHYARMGEPTLNQNVLTHASQIGSFVQNILDAHVIHPVISTMLPNNNRRLLEFLTSWCSDIKNFLFDGDAGLQLSINSTSDEQRHVMFKGFAHTLAEISDLGKLLPNPKGRKYTLNFALADGNEVDAGKLKSLFDPARFLVKITPIHETSASIQNQYATAGGYLDYTPYSKAEEDLKNAGFDVIVFVPSEDEDKSRITCGNAVLGDSLKGVAYEKVSIKTM